MAIGLTAAAVDAFGASGRSPAGVALIASVDRAYTHVPAAIVKVSAAGVAGQFTEIMKGGSVVAEAYTGTDSSGTTVLVAPAGSPTYAKEPHTSCWRLLSRSAPQALDDVGHPLLNFPANATIGAPRATSTGSVVTVSASGTTLVLTIAQSHLVQSIVATHAGVRGVEDLTNLTSAPALPDPTPRC